MEFRTDNAQVSKKDYRAIEQKLKPYSKELALLIKNGGYEVPEGSVNLPGDINPLEETFRAYEKLYTEELKYIIFK